MKRHNQQLENYQQHQKDSLIAWKKEQEAYNQVIHGELVELGESKLLVAKLSE